MRPIIYRMIVLVVLAASGVLFFVAVAQRPRSASSPASPSAAAQNSVVATIDDRIRVIKPQPHAAIRSPLRIEGEARGGWFFEASFPIRLLDGNGKEIAVAAAEAQDEWMTESFVPFRAEMIFTAPAGTGGTLVFEQNNPSGLPEHAAEFQVPVTFAPD